MGTIQRSIFFRLKQRSKELQASQFFSLTFIDLKIDHVSMMQLDQQNETGIRDSY